MATQDALLVKAIDAIKDVFNDTSVPQSTTRESLEIIAEEIEVLLDSLEK